MDWQQIREQHPEQWLLIEADEARSVAGRRLLDRISVVASFGGSSDAMKACSRLHVDDPARELYVFHTSRASLDITERRWPGIRGLP